jgi:Uma2 family endonuclease
MELPPLESGDRLTRDEFERRFDAMPNLKKAELIEGVVYVSPTVSFTLHAEPHGLIVTSCVLYCTYTPGTDCSDGSHLRLDQNNMPQPDMMLFLNEPLGAAGISDDGYVEGAPELIAEVTTSSASYELHDKLNAYQRNGVREYLVWRTFDGELDWFRLRGKKYVRVQPDDKGVIASSVFPGLRLNVKALLTGNMKKVLAELQKGLKSKEHAEFIQRLAKRAGGGKLSSKSK